jgi:hypothetical protein
MHWFEEVKKKKANTDETKKAATTDKADQEPSATAPDA